MCVKVVKGCLEGGVETGRAETTQRVAINFLCVESRLVLASVSPWALPGCCGLLWAPRPDWARPPRYSNSTAQRSNTSGLHRLAIRPAFKIEAAPFIATTIIAVTSVLCTRAPSCPAWQGPLATHYWPWGCPPSLPAFGGLSGYPGTTQPGGSSGVGGQTSRLTRPPGARKSYMLCLVCQANLGATATATLHAVNAPQSAPPTERAADPSMPPSLAKRKGRQTAKSQRPSSRPWNESMKKKNC